MTNVIYNRNIPDGPNNPSQDQPKMKTNTNSLDDLISIDHIGFGNNQGGYHNVIHQPPQTLDPAVLAGIGQLYTRTISGAEELFYRSGTTGIVSRLTPANPNILVTGTVMLTTSFATVLTLPTDCIGFIMLASSIGVFSQVGFFTKASVLTTQADAVSTAFGAGTGFSTVLAQPSGLNLQLKAQINDVIAHTYTAAYWTY